MAVFQFLFSVWTVIWSYQPDAVSTMAFAAMASLAAVSLLATWLLGLAAVGFTGVYAVAKLAETAQVWYLHTQRAVEHGTSLWLTTLAMVACQVLGSYEPACVCLRGLCVCLFCNFTVPVMP